MLHGRKIILTALAMLAFAGNSLLCRAALKHTSIDSITFTCVRLASGALILWLIVRVRQHTRVVAGSWISALALCAYAIGFSIAYVNLPTASGALLLFGAVQATMISHGIRTGERLLKLQLVGLTLAFCGLVGLLLPGLSAPPLSSSALMLSAGFAWGVYSLRGKNAGDAIQISAGNFLRAAPIAIIFSGFMLDRLSADYLGLLLAVASGAVASGIGYAIWYSVLPALKSTNAATVQLSVPVISTLGGVVFLGEPITMRMVLASAAILGGIALVIWQKQSAIDIERMQPTERM